MGRNKTNIMLVFFPPGSCLFFCFLMRIHHKLFDFEGAVSGDARRPQEQSYSGHKAALCIPLSFSFKLMISS